jgi:putative ABC transport system permease protein
MFKNYLITTWRSLLRSKGFSVLNIAGLAVGLAVCFLILLFVRAETSYDGYHEGVDRLYRVQRAWLDSDGSIGSEFSTLAPGFVPFLRTDFPEIEKAARIWGPGDMVVKSGDKVFTEPRLFFADPEIFDVLTLPLIQGEPAEVLGEVGYVVVSRTTAHKYFGAENPVGRSLVLPAFNNRDLLVSGVMEDMPFNSHVHFDFLASYATLGGLQGSGADDYFLGTRNFSDNVTGVYIRLAENARLPEILARIPAFIDKCLPARTDEQGRLVKTSSGQTLHFQKVKDIHLFSHTRAEYEPNGDIRTVRLFTVIALFILAIACVNFVNLSTARGARRAREVGLRKVVGAARRMLAVQFLGESFLITLISLVLSAGLMSLALPAFGRFIGYPFRIGHLFSGAGPVILLGGLLVTALAAGLYPALYNPSAILRGELTQGTRGTTLRKSLVVFQFAISIALIFSVTVIARQTRFVRTADLGYDRDNIICIPVERKLSARWTDFKTELLRETSIRGATLSKRAPSGRLLDAPGFWAEVKGERVRNTVGMPHNRVEHDFFKTYGMTIVAGRDFSVDIPSDATEAFILNETAVQRLGFESPEAAVGAPFGTFAPNRNGRVIGVVRDFNYESLHRRIVPIVTYIAPFQANTLSLRIAPGSLGRVMRHVQTVFDAYYPSGAVSYEFLSGRLAALYRLEERTMRMFFFFGLLAVAIGCLGLVGLAAYSAERRTREIGIRKVLGASAAGIAGLLSREFTRWVVLANLVAWPAAYFGMTKWLQSFAYRISIGVWPFVFSGALALVIALATVSYQAVRSARSDPVQALRYQ